MRYGYRRVHVLLRREGWPVNAKRVYRLYRSWRALLLLFHQNCCRNTTSGAVKARVGNRFEPLFSLCRRRGARYGVQSSAAVRDEL